MLACSKWHGETNYATVHKETQVCKYLAQYMANIMTYMQTEGHGRALITACPRGATQGMQGMHYRQLESSFHAGVCGDTGGFMILLCTLGARLTLAGCARVAVINWGCSTLGGSAERIWLRPVAVQSPCRFRSSWRHTDGGRGAHHEHEGVGGVGPRRGALRAGEAVRAQQIVQAPAHLALAPVQHRLAVVRQRGQRVLVVRAQPAEVRHEVRRRERDLQPICTCAYAGALG